MRWLFHVLRVKNLFFNFFCPQKVEKTTPKSSILKQKFRCFRNFSITAQQPKWQNSCSKMWPIEHLYIELGFYQEPWLDISWPKSINTYVIVKSFSVTIYSDKSHARVSRQSLSAFHQHFNLCTFKRCIFFSLKA